MTSQRAGIPGLLRLSLAAIAATWMIADSRAEPLGRLFFTPERRAALERQRQLNIEEKTQETIEVANVHLNGVVRRGANKTTVWVNGRPQQLDNTTAGIQVLPSSKEMDRVGIRVGDETPSSLRVGETLNRSTQETTDGLGGGQVQINRAHSEKPPRR
ncbi:MAG: hypothetical protein WCV99_07050 [Sterolibacterium sp.]